MDCGLLPQWAINIDIMYMIVNLKVIHNLYKHGLTECHINYLMLRMLDLQVSKQDMQIKVLGKI